MLVTGWRFVLSGVSHLLACAVATLVSNLPRDGCEITNRCCDITTEIYLSTIYYWISTDFHCDPSKSGGDTTTDFANTTTESYK